jgi:hypothetical protein
MCGYDALKLRDDMGTRDCREQQLLIWKIPDASDARHHRLDDSGPSLPTAILWSMVAWLIASVPPHLNALQRPGDTACGWCRARIDHREIQLLVHPSQLIVARTSAGNTEAAELRERARRMECDRQECG